MTIETFAMYCLCGAAWKGRVPSNKAAVIRRIWEETHSGPGCGPTTAKKASEVRRRQEAQE